MSSLILILLSIISVNSNIFIHLKRMNRKEDNGLPKYQINPKFINCLKQKPCLPIALLNHYQNTESVQLGVNFEFDIKYQFKDIQEKNIINTRLSICAMTTLQKNNKGNKHFKPNQPPKENPTCSDEDKNTFSKCLCAKSKNYNKFCNSSFSEEQWRKKVQNYLLNDFNEEFVECVKKCKCKDYLAEILLAKA